MADSLGPNSLSQKVTSFPHLKSLLAYLGLSWKGLDLKHKKQLRSELLTIWDFLDPSLFYLSNLQDFG